MNEENILQNEIETVDPSNDAEDAPVVNDDTNWYIVQTYSGHEKKVKANLEQRIKSMDMSSKIFQVIIPTQNEIEIREGQKKTITKKYIAKLNKFFNGLFFLESKSSIIFLYLISFLISFSTILFIYYMVI